MCGFAAAIGLLGAPVNEALLARMIAPIVHRGPDDFGLTVTDGVGLGFRRLSILDLSPLGHQPMRSRDGAATIVFNGEIYNFPELREQLETLGERFASRGDTEVLLAAYRVWGVRCVERLNGMWAFVIHDHVRGRVIVSRDRFGMKPLYLHRSAQYLLFASEVKSLCASGLYEPRVHQPTLAMFLAEGRLDETPQTFYDGVEAVPPAATLEIDPSSGRIVSTRFWSLPDAVETTPADPAQTFAELFEDAVRVHLRSDVPVGVNLSGGLDSTSILCAVARTRQAEANTQPLLAFCYHDARFDESAYVNATLSQTHAQPRPLATDALRLWGDFERMVWFQDEPVHSPTALIGYQLMRLAADNGVKVVLNGQGADETLAGYPSYFPSYWLSLLGAGRVGMAWREIAAHAAAHGGSPLRVLGGLLAQIARAPLRALPAYRELAARARHRRAQDGGWLDPSVAQALPWLAESYVGGALDHVLRCSVENAPLPLYLRVEDRNAMAHSVEARLPFLDHRLVEFAFSLPPEWHMRGPWNKYVLRRAMIGRIPAVVHERLDKMGFPSSYGDWFAGPLREPLHDLFASRRFRERGLFDAGRVQSMLVDHAECGIDARDALFRIAQTELWLRRCIDVQPAEESACA